MWCLWGSSSNHSQQQAGLNPFNNTFKKANVKRARSTNWVLRISYFPISGRMLAANPPTIKYNKSRTRYHEHWEFTSTRNSLGRKKHINGIYRYNSEDALGRLRGIGSEQKKSSPRNLLLGKMLQKGLDFVPRTGFDKGVELSFA